MKPFSHPVDLARSHHEMLKLPVENKSIIEYFIWSKYNYLPCLLPSLKNPE